MIIAMILSASSLLSITHLLKGPNYTLAEWAIHQYHWVTLVGPDIYLYY